MTASPEPLSLLQITDLHIQRSAGATLVGINTELHFHAVLDLAFANNAHYDLALVTGDLAQDPSLTSYQRILKSLAAFDCPYVCLPGNHDNYELMQQIFNTEKINCRKQTVFENWQVLCLNSQIIGGTGGRLAASELQFLRACLEQYPDHYALIAMHHHCVPTGSTWMDTMQIENSEELLGLIRRFSRAKVIITGHVHQSKDDCLGSVRVLSTPSSCFQFEPESKDFSVDHTAPGFRRIKLYADGSVETEVVRLPRLLNELETDTQGY